MADWDQPPLKKPMLELPTLCGSQKTPSKQADDVQCKVKLYTVPIMEDIFSLISNI